MRISTIILILVLGLGLSLLGQNKSTPKKSTPTPSPTPISTPTVGTTRKNSIGMEFVYIPTGSFMMGSEKGVDNVKPVRRITIKKPFWMGKYEVTIGEWKKVMGEIPEELKEESGIFRNYENQPVMYMSWNGAKAFIAKLNVLNDGFEYSLPSEAQWEYAARAGTKTEYAFGDKLNWEQANCQESYLDNIGIKRKNLEKTSVVGSYKANAWGLYDMHGNVWEWTKDIYTSSYNYGRLPVDGTANLSIGDPSFRVVRGGAWWSSFGMCTSAARQSAEPADTQNYYGFRVLARSR